MFEREYLLSGGIKETFEFLKTIDIEYADKIKREMDVDENNPLITDDQVRNWIQWKKQTFDKYNYPENIEDQVAFYIAVKDQVGLEIIFKEWYDRYRDWEKKDVSKLLSILHLLNDGLLTIECLRGKIELFDGELMNHALLQAYLEAMISENQYFDVLELIEFKLMDGMAKRFETLLLSKAIEVIQKTTDEDLRGQGMKLVNLNKGKLNQNLLHKIKDI